MAAEVTAFLGTPELWVDGARQVKVHAQVFNSLGGNQVPSGSTVEVQIVPVSSGLIGASASALSVSGAAATGTGKVALTATVPVGWFDSSSGATETARVEYRLNGGGGSTSWRVRGGNVLVLLVGTTPTSSPWSGVLQFIPADGQFLGSRCRASRV